MYIVLHKNLGILSCLEFRLPYEFLFNPFVIDVNVQLQLLSMHNSGCKTVSSCVKHILLSCKALKQKLSVGDAVMRNNKLPE